MLDLIDVRQVIEVGVGQHADAVEETLLPGVRREPLEPLAEGARSDGWIGPSTTGVPSRKAYSMRSTAGVGCLDTGSSPSCASLTGSLRR